MRGFSRVREGSVTKVSRTHAAYFDVTLREMREGCGWSQRDVARLTGLDRGMICKLEQGTRDPGRRSIERLVKLFRLSAYEADLFRVLAGFAPQYHGVGAPSIDPAQGALQALARIRQVPLPLSGAFPA
jgi:transcriptional regulator with XRE-family HTH domain